MKEELKNEELDQLQHAGELTDAELEAVTGGKGPVSVGVGRPGGFYRGGFYGGGGYRYRGGGFYGGGGGYRFGGGYRRGWW